jgi:hypothetical protein
MVAKIFGENIFKNHNIDPRQIVPEQPQAGLEKHRRRNHSRASAQAGGRQPGEGSVLRVRHFVSDILYT